MKNGRDSFLRGHETHPARPLTPPLSITPWKFNSSPPENGWQRKTIRFPIWGPATFSGANCETSGGLNEKTSQRSPPRGTLDADRCSIFFVDDMRKEVWCVGSLDMDAMAVKTMCFFQNGGRTDEFGGRCGNCFWCTWKFGKRIGKLHLPERNI